MLDDARSAVAPSGNDAGFDPKVNGLDGQTSGRIDMGELASLLADLPDDGWVVDEVLSQSEFETTQIVHRDKGMVSSKFVRKVFTRDVGLGLAYQRVLAAQAEGKRFEHLPIVYDMAETDEGVAVVSEFVRGETLQRYVKSHGGGVEIAVTVARGLCDAMRELHEELGEPIVHRDLKPSNIMIADGRIMLIDLGIARTWHADGSRDTVRLGTPGYAPPEQFGYGQTTPQSDIYAAGMVVAFCLLGDDPHSTLRESGFMDARIPPAFRPVLAKATAFDPAQRYASAREFGAAIEQAAAGDAGQQARTAQSDGLGRNSRSLKVPRGVGMAWNIVLLIAWVLLTAASIGASITGGTEFLDRLPMWVRFVEYCGIVIIPSALLVVLLADKRRLRDRFPQLQTFTFKRLVAICLGSIAALYFVSIAFYMAFFAP